MTKPVTRKLAVDCILYRMQRGLHISGDNLGDIFYMPCGLCEHFLMPGEDIQFDHIHADVFDGPHEYQNLRPVHAECHKKKTAQDIKANAKVKRLANPKPSNHPMKSSGRKIPSRPFPKRAA